MGRNKKERPNQPNSVPTGINHRETSEKDYDSCEKETYVKHIRNDLKRWCTADELARVIGGDFTPEFVNQIYDEFAPGSKGKTRNGKPLLERDRFLEHFEANIVMDDVCLHFLLHSA